MALAVASASAATRFVALSAGCRAASKNFALRTGDIRCVLRRRTAKMARTVLEQRRRRRSGVVARVASA